MGDVAKGLKSFKKGMTEDEEAEQRRLSAERTIDQRPASPTVEPAATPAAAPEADRH
jgi:sec-independent protein translocase protein TatA